MPLDDAGREFRCADECYRILELPFGASHQQIKQRYRDLARVWHPDRFVNDERLRRVAEGKLIQINSAYECLIRAAEPIPAKAANAPEPSHAPAPDDGQQSRPAQLTSTRAGKCFRRSRPRHSTPLLACTAATLLASFAIFSATRLYGVLAPPFRSVQALLDQTGHSYSPRAEFQFERLDTLSTAVQVFTVFGQVTSSLSPVPEQIGSVPLTPTPQRKPPERSHMSVVRSRSRNQVLYHTIIAAGAQGTTGALTVRNRTLYDAAVQVKRWAGEPVYTILVPKQGQATLEITFGVYECDVDFGADWDEPRRAFAHGYGGGVQVGPLQTYQSSSGSWADRYEVVLRE